MSIDVQSSVCKFILYSCIICCALYTLPVFTYFKEDCTVALCAAAAVKHKLTLQHKSPIVPPSHHECITAFCTDCKLLTSMTIPLSMALAIPFSKDVAWNGSTYRRLVWTQTLHARRLWWNDDGNTETQQLLCLPSDAHHNSMHAVVSRQACWINMPLSILTYQWRQ